MKKYSIEIAQAIKEHLEEEMKLVAFDEESGSFGFVMHLRGAISFIQYIVKVHKDDYTVVAICPVSVDTSNSAMLAKMAEFVTRANYGLKNGNFEMDFRDGELRYKCFVDCDEQVPNENMIRNSVLTPAAMMERYACGIINVLYSGMTAECAVEECDNERKLLRKLEEAKRALESQCRKHYMDAEGEPKQQDAIMQGSDDAGLPSYDEYLLMTAEEDAETEDAFEDFSDNDGNASVE